MSVRYCFLLVFVSISLMVNDVEPLFPCLLAVCPQEGYSLSLGFSVKICTVGMEFLSARTDAKV